MRTIRRQRTVISSDSASQLPDSFKKTDRGEDFLLYESDELIIFTTKTNLPVSKNCKHWFADGTFKVSNKCNLSKIKWNFFQVCPDDFYQLFTLHALFTSQIIPLVYGLLIGKDTSDYNKFFERILEEDDFEPISILTDFESGIIKSVQSMFHGVLHKGKPIVNVIN